MDHIEPPTSPPALTAEDVIALGLLYEARIARLRAGLWLWRGLCSVTTALAVVALF